MSPESENSVVLWDGPLILLGEALLSYSGKTPPDYFPERLNLASYSDEEKEFILKLSGGFKEACDQYTDGSEEQDACWHGVMFGLDRYIEENDGKNTCNDYVDGSANKEACQAGERISKPEAKKARERGGEEIEEDDELDELEELPTPEEGAEEPAAPEATRQPDPPPPPLFQAEFNYSGLNDSLALKEFPSITLNTINGAPLGFEGRIGFRWGPKHFKMAVDAGGGYAKRSTGNKAVGGRDTYLEEGRFSFGITPLAQISLSHQARLMVGGEIRGFVSLLDTPPLTTEEICLGYDGSGNCAEYSENLVGGFPVVPWGTSGFTNINLKGWGYGFETGPEVVFGIKNLEVGARFGFQQAYFPDDREQTGSYQGSFLDFIVRGVFP